MCIVFAHSLQEFSPGATDPDQHDVCEEKNKYSCSNDCVAVYHLYYQSCSYTKLQTGIVTCQFQCQHAIGGGVNPSKPTERQ